MNTTIKTILISVVTSLVVAFLVVGLTSHDSATLGAQVQNDVFNFTSGFNAGKSNQFAISNAGALTSSGAITLSGAATLSSSVLLNRASSTLSIIGSSDKTGCIAIGDVRGGSYPTAYITVSSSTISASTTKPAICN